MKMRHSAGVFGVALLVAGVAAVAPGRSASAETLALLVGVSNCPADSVGKLYCGWTPRWTGPFKIRVVNRGDSGNRYALITN